MPVLVLVQNEEARIPLNTTLARDAVFAALGSKNVVLNTLTTGPNFVNAFGRANLDSTKRLFDLSPYETSAGAFGDLRVLGVEADAADGVRDGQHALHAFDTNLNQVPASLPATEAAALQVSYNGSNTGDTGMVGSGKSILIGQDLSGGLGETAAGYRAKSVGFEYFDLLSPATYSASINYSFDFYGAESQVWADEDGLLRFTSTDISGDNADLSQLATALPG